MFRLMFEARLGPRSMSRPRIPQSLAAREFEARLTPSHQAKTLATRLPRAEMLAVEEAAQAAGQTCSQWLREAAIAHLKRPVRSRKSKPDPTLLTELMGLRQLTVNLFAAVAGSSISPDQVRDIVRQADHVKEGKADEILRRLHDATEGK